MLRAANGDCVNFDLSEDQMMLKAVAERFISDRYNIDQRRAAARQPQGYCQDNWALLGSLGLIGMAFDIENDGMAASPTDLAVVFEALGRGLMVEPLIDSILVAGKLFEAHAPPALKTAWMADLVSGKRRLAFAHREQRARGNPAWVETRATEVGAGWQLTGTKPLVRAGCGADGIIVSARISGEDASPDGVGLFLVAGDAPGLTSTPYRLIDGTAASEVMLQGVQAERLGGDLRSVQAAEARANIARGAEALGIMDMLFAATLDYLRTRKQFGVALGSFQALQHRMVAQYALIEQARGLLDLAVMADPADSATWVAAIAGARAFISEASVKLGHEMVQLHGGMGVTDELIIGHGHKRLLMLSRYPEDAAAALDIYAGVSAAL
jgi:alkylation response protein AidB-like acyl-CoA dehydrogenase